MRSVLLVKGKIKVKSSASLGFNYFMMLDKTTLITLQDFLNSADILFEGRSESHSTTDFEAHPASMIVYPKDRHELRCLVLKLDELKAPFHLVSAGHNWGYGDSNLTENVSILVHLRRLNQILNYDADLGTIEIEPGVTQEQVANFLLEHKSEWVLDITGSDRSSSVVGNFLERGFGHTSAGDHERNSKVVEVLKPDGVWFCPQLVSDGASLVRGLYQHDVGLNLDRIFYQTHLAIVTKMVVHLKPKNKQTSFCTVFLETEHEVALAIASISRLKILDVLTSVPHIGNLERIQKTSRHQVDSRMKWVATIDISGPADLVRVRKKMIKECFPNQRTFFFSATLVSWIERFMDWLPATSLYRNQFENLKLLTQLYSGIPSDAFVLNSIGENIKIPKKMNWIGPLFPSQAEHFIKVKAIVTQIFSDYNLSFSATVSVVSSRCAVMIAEIADSQNMGISESDLQECYERCHEALWGAGYPIYRYGLRAGVALETQMRQNPEYLKIYEDLKKHLDPNDVLSRGRWGLHLSK